MPAISVQRLVATAALVAAMVVASGPTPRAVQPAAQDDPSDFSAVDLANAAAQSGLASSMGQDIATGKALEETLKALQNALCLLAFGGPCPPDDTPPPESPSGGDAPEIQKEDVIPIYGTSSTPVDEVMDDSSELVTGASGPFAAEGPVSLASVRKPTSLPNPVMIVTGPSNGVMELRVYSSNGLSPDLRRNLQQLRGIFAPLGVSTARRIQERLAAVATPGSGVHLTRAPLRGYCVESKNRAPSKNAMYVLAPRAVQEEYAPVRPVRAMAEFAARRGYLRPQGDPVEYGRFITQYAIWTKVEHWNEARFTDEFITRTRRALEDEHRSWTKETEQTLRAIAPSRWRDVRLVVAAAAKASEQLRARGQGAQ